MTPAPDDQEEPVEALVLWECHAGRVRLVWDPRPEDLELRVGDVVELLWIPRARGGARPRRNQVEILGIDLEGRILARSSRRDRPRR